jgi:hypothetical protein
MWRWAEIICSIHIMKDAAAIEGHVKGLAMMKLTITKKPEGVIDVMERKTINFVHESSDTEMCSIKLDDARIGEKLV